MGHFLALTLKSSQQVIHTHICLQGKIMVSILSLKHIEQSFPSLFCIL